MNSSSNVVAGVNGTHYSAIGGLRGAGASIINSSLSTNSAMIGGSGAHGALIVPHVKLHQIKPNMPPVMNTTHQLIDDSLLSNPYSVRDPNGNVTTHILYSDLDRTHAIIIRLQFDQAQ
jgi:hypothetical protein